MLTLEKKDDVNPRCPHCKAELTSLWFREIMGTLGKRFIYFCPQCTSCLGVSHRKGFWMG